MPNKTILSLADAAAMLPVRNQNGHKGTFGKAMMICGSKTMVGCCVLACEGALRSGIGIGVLAFPECLYNTLTSRLTENLFLPLADNGEGFIGKENISYIIEKANECDVVLLGCGIGVNDDVKSVVKAIVENVNKPMIIDADGLNCLSFFKDSLLKRNAQTLLTPHPGEMARLCGCEVHKILQDAECTLSAFCKKYNVNVLLKGHRTLICNNDGSQFYENETGNTGLSKGGSGDLLSGIITGLAPSLGCDLFKAAALGAFIHGFTADLLKNEFSEYVMLPSDCAKYLNKTFKYLEEYN